METGIKSQAAGVQSEALGKVSQSASPHACALASAVADWRAALTTGARELSVQHHRGFKITTDYQAQPSPAAHASSSPSSLPANPRDLTQLPCFPEEPHVAPPAVLGLSPAHRSFLNSLPAFNTPLMALLREDRHSCWS